MAYTSGQVLTAAQLNTFAPGTKITLPDGTVSAPALAFTDDTNTGIYSASADTINFATGGTLRATINSSGITAALVGDVTGNASTASKWAAATTLTLAGDLSGSVVFDGSDTTETLTAVVANNSHTHTGTTLSAIPASDITSGDFGSGDYKVTGKMRATTSFLVSSTGDDGIGPVTGEYGSVQTVGTGAGSYEGYSINGQHVFMSNGTEVVGIWNDHDNQWLLKFDADNYTQLYDSNGIVAFGATNYTSGGTGSAGNGYVGISTYCGGFSGTTAVVTSTTVAGVAMKRLGFTTSSYEFKTGIEDLAMSDEAFMSLKPITFHPNDQYVDSTGDVTEIVGGHTIVPDSVEAGETAGLMPLKRAGFGLEDLYGREDTMILATEFAPDSNALIALLTLKLQETMTRVDALETAA